MTRRKSKHLVELKQRPLPFFRCSICDVSGSSKEDFNYGRSSRATDYICNRCVFFKTTNKIRLAGK